MNFENLSSGMKQSNWLIDSSSVTLTDMTYTFSGIGKYSAKLIISDTLGNCFDTIQKEIDLNSIGKSELKIPNVFTPNGDQVNDCYELGGISKECGDKAVISIYNRWGERVYYGDLAQECWNGKLNNSGNELPAGVYFYLVELTYYNLQGQLNILKTNGVIHLIR